MAKTFSMKQALLIAVVFGGLIVSSGGCTKENAIQYSYSKNNITGSWELRKASAAMNPDIQKYAPGNGNILKFTDSSYERFVNGSLTNKGVFEIINDTTAEASVCLVFANGAFANRIIFDTANNDIKIFVQIDGNKMTFISGCYAYDAGHSEEYEKQ